MHKLKEHGADVSWTACFVIPNVSCPGCFAKVYYYQNVHGSRVFFDELGKPWPKHDCRNTHRQKVELRTGTPSPIVARTRGAARELLEVANVAEFDPNAKFRTKYGYSPIDLFSVTETRRVGFIVFVQAVSISPPLEDPVFVSFVSANMSPVEGEYFSFDGTEVSFVNSDNFVPKSFKATAISSDEFLAAPSKGMP